MCPINSIPSFSTTLRLSSTCHYSCLTAWGNNLAKEQRHSRLSSHHDHWGEEREEAEVRSELLIFLCTSTKPFSWLISLGEKQEVQGNLQKPLYTENEFYHLPDWSHHQVRGMRQSAGMRHLAYPTLCWLPGQLPHQALQTHNRSLLRLSKWVVFKPAHCPYEFTAVLFLRALQSSW